MRFSDFKSRFNILTQVNVGESRAILAPIESIIELNSFGWLWLNSCFAELFLPILADIDLCPLSDDETPVDVRRCCFCLVDGLGSSAVVMEILPFRYRVSNCS